MSRGMTRKKRIAVVAAVVVIAILLIASLWFFVIPRTEMHVITVYHEGSTGIINVNVKLDNRGTVDAEKVSVHVLVSNATAVFLDETAETTQISPRESHEFKMHFVWDQYEHYVIEVTVDFDTESEHFSEEFVHRPGGYMTERFEDTMDKVHV